MTTAHANYWWLAPRWQTLVSAVCLAAALPPWNLYPIVFVGLVPWLSQVAGATSLRRSLAQGFWLSFALGLLAAPWLATGVREFLLVPWPLAVLVLLLFAATCAAPYLFVFGGVVRWAMAGETKASLAALLGLAGAFGALDSFVPRLFDVGLGYALHSAVALRQAADVGGVELLSFAIGLVNLLVWQMWERGKRKGWKSGGVVACAAGVVSVLAALVSYGLTRPAALPATRTLDAVIVQGNVANATRLDWARGEDAAAESQLTSYLLPTEKLANGAPLPDLIVWPEATFPGIFRKPTSKAQRARSGRFDRMVLRLDIPIVFGAYDLIEGEGGATLFNSLFSITPNFERRGARGFVQTYRKHDLLPFAEALPLVGESEWVRRLLPSFGAFGRGPGPVVLEIKDREGQRVAFGPVICSEALGADNVVGGVRNGSQMILNIGSDGWFASEAEAEFHLAIARFRSIETRRPQLRAANTGISALILASGEIAAQTEFDEATMLSVKVPITEPRDTLRVRWGGWVGPASLVLSLLCALAEWRVRAVRG